MQHVVSEAISRNELGLSVGFRAAVTPSEKLLVKIWEEVLQVDSIGVDDDFFNLGGDSLAATILASEVETRFDIVFSPANLMSCSTVGLLANFCDENIKRSAAKKLPSYVTSLNPDGNRPPLFLLHGGNGFTLFKNIFFDIIGDEQQVYIFQAPGIDGRDSPLTSVKEFSSAYTKVLRAVNPLGPWRIAASCTGSLIAMEMCHDLTVGGGNVDKLILIDPPMVPDAVRPLYPTSLGKKIRLFTMKSVNALLGRGFILDAGAIAYRKSLKNRARMQMKLEQRFHSRELGTGPIQAEIERSYQPEDMLRTSLALQDALAKCVPRSWAGNARIIGCTRRHGNEVKNYPFWENHLNKVEYDLIEGSHDDMFTSKLEEVAALVARALDDSPRNSQQTV